MKKGRDFKKMKKKKEKKERKGERERRISNVATTVCLHLIFITSE